MRWPRIEWSSWFLILLAFFIASYLLVEHLRDMPFIFITRRLPVSAIRIYASREACILANSKTLTVKWTEAIDGIAHVVQQTMRLVLSKNRRLSVAYKWHRSFRNRYQQIVFYLGCPTLRIEFDGEPLDTRRELNTEKKKSIQASNILFPSSDCCNSRVTIDRCGLIWMIAFNNAIMIACGDQITVWCWSIRCGHQIIPVVSLGLTEIVAIVGTIDLAVEFNGRHFIRWLFLRSMAFIQCGNVRQDFSNQCQYLYRTAWITAGQGGNVAENQRQQSMENARRFMLENVQNFCLVKFGAVVVRLRQTKVFDVIAIVTVVPIDFRHLIRLIDFVLFDQIFRMNFGCADFNFIFEWICWAFIEFQRLHDPLWERFKAFGEVARSRCITRLVCRCAIHVRIIGKVDVEVLFDWRDILFRVNGLCVIGRIETLFGGRNWCRQSVSRGYQQLGALLRDVTWNLQERFVFFI